MVAIINKTTTVNSEVGKVFPVKVDHTKGSPTFYLSDESSRITVHVHDWAALKLTIDRMLHSERMAGKE
jgi:hypothetical protein